jgi:uncharacterized SAM-binding protein YcdF (DUF218 family)
MFFILSKTIGLLLLPSNLLIEIGFAGLVLLALRRRRTGTALMAACLILLMLVGYLPIGKALAHILEDRFPPWNPRRGPPDGIIVLGGAIDPLLSQTRGMVALDDEAERVTVIAGLARAYPKARIVYSSGNGVLFPHARPEADFAAPLLESFGVAPGRITLENRSRNTYENALFTKALVKPKPGEHWLLVTSAQHMPRAIGCFRRVGFPVEAYPVDWNTRPHLHLMLTDGLSAGLHRADEAAHEWIGLAAYWLSGRTATFFPGPTGQSSH